MCTQWLSKYGLEALGLNSSRLEVQKKDKQTQKKAYKHINKKVQHDISMHVSKLMFAGRDS